MSSEGVLPYCCAPDVIWVKDTQTTLVIDQQTGRARTLYGLEAVIWDLFTLGYSLEGVVRFVDMLVRSGDHPQQGSELSAQEVTLAVVDAWRQAGFLHANAEGGCG